METPNKPGRLLSWRWLNELVSSLRAAKIVAGQNVRVEQTAAAQVVSVKLPQEADFRIAGGTNPYAGVEQRPVAGGTWANLPGGRTVTATADPLYERNGEAAIAVGTVVHARRDPASGAWIFDRSSCS